MRYIVAHPCVDAWSGYHNRRQDGGNSINKVAAMNTKLVLIGLLATILAGNTSVANCQGRGCGFPYAPAYWGYGYSNSYTSESVPYFALHPPVYYSYRVARTYGYSPFAYPPCVMAPGSEQLLGDSSHSPYRSKQPEPEPLMIVNPFVEPSGDTAVTNNQKPISRRPQVVYPAALARQSY